ncbi:hypothetical protein I7I50_01898 [Histoplasma capsulatum G186AR]|uniref:Uncharacterized protein n=1 Tax=Ajellomyces capsulatus TaxID=5037 RepID=A0A8H7YFE6_AJECA|nr:hypothetical protein I7I52_12112 [Histoplasma capsulatum]QSS71159.1 hypothetical protein I7I50_01898 [Histoplasma capsulatum G186AR]
MQLLFDRCLGSLVATSLQICLKPLAKKLSVAYLLDISHRHILPDCEETTSLPHNPIAQPFSGWILETLQLGWVAKAKVDQPDVSLNESVPRGRMETSRRMLR